MNKLIPFVSFKALEQELREEIRNVFERVYENSCYIGGKEDENFEREFARYSNAKYCVGCGNGLDALMLALKALNIGEGDEVIVPANTFIATALAVSYVGATPVLVDPDIRTYNIDVTKIEEKITNKTKAIIPVHLYGQPADMNKIIELAQKYDLYIVEDCAQAHGAKYHGKVVGSFGEVGSFSFYPGKNLGALGDGGAIITNQEMLANKIRAMGNYGSFYKYHHVYKGNNSRLDELQAGILNVKLKHLDRTNLERNRIAQRYLSGINNPKIILPSVIKNVEHVWHIFAIRCVERDKLEKYLKKANINTNIHYPIPIHLQEAYKDLELKEGGFAVSEEISKTELSLPMYYGLSDEQIDYVISVINEF